MVKYFIAVLFSVILISPVYSQNFKAGVQFGITASQVDGDNLTGYNKAGLYGGFFVNHPAGERGDFQLEIDFSQKGSRKNADPANGIYDSYIMRLSYVEVPVFYNYKIKKFMAVHGGLSAGYLIFAKEYDNYGQIDPATSSAPPFRKLELAALAGLSFNYKENWFLSFRFSYSIIPIRDTPIQPFAYFNKPQHNNLIITALQYRF